jgi:hypothetical protein
VSSSHFFFFFFSALIKKKHQITQRSFVNTQQVNEFEEAAGVFIALVTALSFLSFISYSPFSISGA